MSSVFTSSPSAPAAPVAQAHWFVYRGIQLLVREGEGPPLPSREELAAVLGGELEAGAHFLGTLDELPCFALPLPEGPVPGGFETRPLRPLFGRLPERLWTVAGRAVQILEWDRTHRYCGACATPTVGVPGERARRCPTCDLTFYPRLSPAIIVLVRRGDEALLGQGNRFPGAFYSTLAGFVEPGETLEEALVREVREEVGVEVKDLRYFGSQPWPFPHSLMIGFHATYVSGELRPDPAELVDAKWFRYDALPRIPPRPSIARQLIDAWIADCTRGAG